MTIVTTGRALLEVTCLHARDVPGAVAGGADRLLLCTEPGPGGVGTSPEPAAVSAVCRDSDVPVRVLLRLNDGWSTGGGEFARLVGLAQEYLVLGADSLSFGFLDADLDIDAATTAELVGALPSCPWSFHRGFDAALGPERAWRAIASLPGLDGVVSAGSPRGFAEGAEELITRAADPVAARLLVASGGLLAEQVPWLVRAGIRQYAVGPEARPGGSWSRSYVDAGHVRSWRTLLDDLVDDAVARRAR